MTQIALSNDLSTLTTEIQFYKQMANQSLFEIAKRLKHVKENDLAHGQWEAWCESSLSFTPRQARKYIRVYERFSERNLGSEIGIKKLDLLVEFTDEELETPQTLPTGEVKKLPEMSNSEIEQYKKAQKEADLRVQEAERRANEAEQEKHHYLNLWNQAKSQPPKVVKETVTVNVMPPDYEDLKQQAVNAQHLNNENVKLMRANQDIREMYEQKLTQQNKRESAKRDLQKYLAEQIRSITMNHDSAILMYQGIQGDKEAYEIVMRYLTQYESIIKKQFHEWEQLTTIRAIN